MWNLRRLSLLFTFGVLLPIVAIVLALVTEHVSFLGGGGVMGTMFGVALVCVSSSLMIAEGMVLLPKLRGRDRLTLVALIVLGGSPVVLALIYAGKSALR